MTSSLFIDGVVLLAYFGIIIFIGLSQRRKSNSMEGFTLGNREMAWWAVLASIIAAEISAATFLGAPGEGFAKHNWTYAQLAIGTLIARILVGLIFIPLFYKHGVVSIYEFLEIRFGRLSRKFASATFLITRVLAMGTRLYVAAIIVVMAYELFSGQKATSQQTFWLFSGALILISILTALYTTIGGIRAVIWTDFIQVTILIAALIFSIVFLFGKIPGGWSEIAIHLEKPIFWSFGEPKGEGLWGWIVGILSDEYTIWTAFIASTFVTMSTHGIDQDTVQRMLTAKNRRQSTFATIMSGVADIPIVSAFIFIGILLSVYFTQNPNPDVPTESREVFPYFILHVMPTGLRGLVTAGILATAMGSLSTALNALATSFSRDFIFSHLKDKNEKIEMLTLRLSTVLFATLIILVGVVTAWYVVHHPEVRIIPLVLGILGYTFGSLLGIFFVAIFTKTRGNDFGNIIAMIIGFLAVAYLSGVDLMLLDTFSPLKEGHRDRELILAFPWRITFGCLVTVFVALLFPTPQKKDL